MSELSNKKSGVFSKMIRLAMIFVVLWAVYHLGVINGRIEGVLAEVPLDEAVLVNKESPEKVVDFSLFWEAWDILKEKYVDHEKLDANKLLYGAIDGMLAATGDPYTTFFDPEEYKLFQTDLTGTFEGIGAEIGIRDDILTIIAPLDGSPAERAGLRAGDKVVKIDGEPTNDITIEEAVMKIRGPGGTIVKLTIYREGETQTRDIEIKRDRIVIKSVKAEAPNEDGIGYIRISRFGEDAAALFRAEAQKMLQSGRLRGLILDLRSNPGGYLTVATKIADMMIPRGNLIVVQEGTDNTRDEIRASGGDFLSHIPTVVLIDEGSASASEILAGALKDDRNNVVVVGTKSFGKGSVQELKNLPHRTAVKITVARWLTPKGVLIDHEGIVPDVEVKLTEEDFKAGRDVQKERAEEILREILKRVNE